MMNTKTAIENKSLMGRKPSADENQNLFSKISIVVNRHVGIAWSTFKSGTAYNFDFFTSILWSLLTMALTYYLWTAIYKSSTSMSMTYEALITYICVGQAFSFGRPGQRAIYTSIGYSVRSGDVMLDLLRPTDFQAMNLSYTLGSYLLDMLAVSLPSYVLALLFFRISLPVSLTAAFGFVISLAGAFFLIFSLDFFLGILAFWMTAVWGLGYAKMAVIDILAGTIVPLSLFPGWLQHIVMALPFKGMAYTPLAIYTGMISGSAIVTNILSQFAWGMGMVLLTRLLWIKARRRIEIQGG